MSGDSAPVDALAEEIAARLGFGSWVWTVADGRFHGSPILRALHGLSSPAEPPAELDLFLAMVGGTARRRPDPGADGRGWSHEQQVRLVRPGGEVREVLRRAHVQYGEDGQPLRILGVDIDLGRLDPPPPPPAAPAAAPGPAPGAPVPGQRAAASLMESVLHALPSHVVVLAPDGTILAANRAWTAFAEANGSVAGTGAGTSYVAVCRAAGDDEGARAALRGVEGVLSGALPYFEMEYPCHALAERRWFLMSVVPLPLGDRRGAVVSHVDITAQKEAEARLVESEALLRLTFESAPLGIAHVSADHRWLRCNARLLEMLGRSADALVGQPSADAIHAEDRDTHAAHLEIMRSGATDLARYEVRLLRADGGEAWASAVLSCVRDAEGGIVHFILGLEDATAARQLTSRQQVLIEELAHRAKNLLAVIQAVTRRTLAAHPGALPARDVLLGRFQALARNYGILAGDGFEGVPLRTILESELASCGAQVRMAGPELLLAPKAMQTFALVAHELGTNAVKYGALSVPEGRVDVAWSVEADDAGGRLRFDWRESGGPPVRRPTREGFGTTLVTRVTAAEFECEPRADYAEEGFAYGFTAPLGPLGALVTASPQRARLRHPMIVALYDTWQRQRPPGGLPRLSGFDWSRFAATGALTLARVGPDGGAEFIRMGRALVERLEGDPEDPGNDLPGLRRLYARCAASGDVRHDEMRVDFGDGRPFRFERLLVPFAADGGTAATHVAGLVVFDGSPTLPPPEPNAYNQPDP